MTSLPYLSSEAHCINYALIRLSAHSDCITFAEMEVLR